MRLREAFGDEHDALTHELLSHHGYRHTIFGKQYWHPKPLEVDQEALHADLQSIGYEHKSNHDVTSSGRPFAPGETNGVKHAFYNQGGKRLTTIHERDPYMASSHIGID